MQGLRSLYQYQGRTAEWARLVAEIVPDYCTPDDAPHPRPGRRATAWSWATASTWPRLRPRPPRGGRLAGEARRLEPPAGRARPRPAGRRAPGRGQRNRIRTLAVSLEALGHILREQGSPDCVAAYEEAIRHCQRIGDTADEAITHFNLGHAYKDLPAIRDLDAAEAAYRRSLDVARSER